MIALAAAAGAMTALALILIARELRPAPPRLDAALARIHTTRTEPTPPFASGDWRRRLGGWLAARYGRPAGVFTVPRSDLALLEHPVERFMLAKLAWFCTGITLPPLAYSLLAATGAAPAWTVPVLVAVLLAAALSFIPDLNVRAQARRHRKDFRYAFGCYLQLVVLERQAGAALNTALEGPATVARGWAFRRIAAALDRARRAQQQPWRALADLGEHVGVRDLVDLAHTAQIAGTEGAKVHDVLSAKITAMRHEAAAATRTEANARTTSMWVPTSLLMLGFVVLVGFPFFSRLLGSG